MQAIREIFLQFTRDCSELQKIAKWFHCYDNLSNYSNVNENVHRCTLKVGHVSAMRLLWISSDRDDQRMFLGLKFSILGLYGVEKFGKIFSCGVFLGIQNNLKFVVVPTLACSAGIFWAGESCLFMFCSCFNI